MKFVHCNIPPCDSDTGRSARVVDMEILTFLKGYSHILKIWVQATLLELGILLMVVVARLHQTPKPQRYFEFTAIKS
jgi:hypothetical protein